VGRDVQVRARFLSIMPIIYEYDLPWPPSVNDYYHRHHAGVSLKKAGRKFRRDVIMIVKSKGAHETLTGPIKMDIYAWPPDRRRRDIDNILKALLDAMEFAGIYHNDYQIEKLNIERYESNGKGNVLVAIQEIEV